MSLTDLLILQFIAHLLADFTFQSNTWSKDKNEKGFKSKYLIWHCLIVFLFSYILSFQWPFIYTSIAITVIHWLIDGLKLKILNHKKITRYAFFIDQSLHLLIITGCVLIFNHFPMIEYFGQILPCISEHILPLYSG